MTNLGPLFHAPGRPERQRTMRRILDRLRYAPATSKELMDYSGALNYRARISEARKLGAIITCRKSAVPGVNIYVLVRDLPDDPNDDGAPA